MTAETDRKLLALAAKAAAQAGMPIIQSVAGPQILERNLSDGTECYRQWRPRTDSCDALELAVKLQMSVQTTNKDATAYADELPDGTNWVTVEITDTIDDMSATRRAIVRAAAEIGRAMPATQGGVKA